MVRPPDRKQLSLKRWCYSQTRRGGGPPHPTGPCGGASGPRGSREAEGVGSLGGSLYGGVCGKELGESGSAGLGWASLNLSSGLWCVGQSQLSGTWLWGD